MMGVPFIPNLRSCPFCGGQAAIVSGGPSCHFIKCVECGASSDDGSKEHAVEAWNRRSPSISKEGE